jgi:hypothetical protein
MSPFPLPQDIELLVLQKIEEHAAENGLIVIKEAEYGIMHSVSTSLCEIESIRFIPYAKVSEFNTEVRRRIDGRYIVESVCDLLLEHYGKTDKPVLVLRRDGTNWIGMLGENKQKLHTIDYLNRCLQAPYGDPQS